MGFSVEGPWSPQIKVPPGIHHLCLFHPQETSGGFGLRFYSNDPAAFLSSTHRILEGALQSLVVMGSAVGKGTAQTLRTPDLAFSISHSQL